MTLRDILKRGGWEDSEIPTAASLAGAESGFNPRKRTTYAPCGTRKDGSKAYAIGLLMVCTIHLDPGGLLEGWTEEDLLDPIAGARAAKIIHKAQGWGAWEAFTNGSFKRFPNAENRNIQTAATGSSLSDKAKAVLSAVVPGSAIGGAAADLVGVDIPNPVDAAGDVASTVTDGIKALSDPTTWFRIGKVWYGGVLMIIGVAGLTFIVARKAVGTAPVKTAAGFIPGGSIVTKALK